MRTNFVLDSLASVPLHRTVTTKGINKIVMHKILTYRNFFNTYSHPSELLWHNSVMIPYYKVLCDSMIYTSNVTINEKGAVSIDTEVVRLK